MEDFKTIHFKEEDSIGYITLNRPKKLNAFNFRMMSEILSSFVKEYAASNSSPAL